MTMKKENDKKILNSFIKRIAIIICIKIAIIFFFFLRAQQKIQNKQLEIPQGPQFCYSWTCINLEIADTPETRELGLMFRENLEENKWMLFIFDKPWRHGMWMRNTLIPLDIIRITTGYKVTDIIQATPCEEETCPTYKPRNDNLWAIEINSGIAQKLKLTTGEIIELKI